MKTLILMRHAKSSWDDSSLDDFDRPLNRRGERDAPFMGGILAGKGVKPDTIVSSPAVRAFATAQAVAEAIGYNLQDIRTDKKLYDASAHRILDIVRGWTDPARSALLVAHNPGLTLLLNLFAGEAISNIPTAGVAAIEFGAEHWSDIQAGEGKMLWFEFPKKFPREH